MATCIANCNLSGRNEKKIMCGGMCNGVFHIKCLGLAEYDLNCIDSRKNVFFICSVCVDFRKCITNKFDIILNEISESKNRFEKQENELKSMLEEIKKVNSSEVLNEIKKIYKENVEKKNFASVVRNEPPVLVKPKKAQNYKKTIEDIQNKVDPADIKYTNIRNKQNGVMIIESDSGRDRDTIKKVFEEKLGKQYDIQVPELRKSKLFISGLGVQMDENEIIEKIKKQNEFLSESDLKCTKIIEKKYKQKSQYNIIVEIDSESFNRAIREERICIGWDRCKVFDATYVKRCYNCLGFNHKADVCKNKKVCERCLGEHLKNTCEADKVEKCSNCIRANEKLNLNLAIEHNVYSRSCQVYLQKLSVEKQRNNY